MTELNSDILKSMFQLTSKQYYKRISDLSNAGLITRKKGKYFLTSFGEIVYKAQELMAQAVRFQSKLKVIDSIDTSELSAFELDKLIDTNK